MYTQTKAEKNLVFIGQIIYKAKIFNLICFSVTS